jgi:hypothetical protein
LTVTATEGGSTIEVVAATEGGLLIEVVAAVSAVSAVLAIEAAVEAESTTRAGLAAGTLEFEFEVKA